MAKKEDDAAKAAAASAAGAKAAGATAALAAAPAQGVADPAPATELDQPSGAIIEPELASAVDVSHESVDANPRAGTTSEQNAIDWNDAKRRRPGDPDFAGQGLDETVYGKGAKA